MDAELREEVFTNGFAVLRSAIPETLIDELRVIVEDLIAGAKAPSSQVLYTHTSVPPDTPHLSSLVDQWLNPHRLRGAGSTRGPVRDVRGLVADLLGEPGVLVQDLIMMKRAEGRPFPWHQDFAYWPVDEPNGLVLWVPLVESGQQSGGLRFAVGSHRLGPRPAVDLHRAVPQAEGAVLGFDPGAYEIASPHYSVGDAAAFLPCTFHASPAMATAGTRPVWSSIWLKPGTRWRHENAPNHPVCRETTDGAPVAELHTC